MPAQPGPRSDQLAQRSTTLGNVLTAGSVVAPDPLAVPSYQPSTITGRVGEGTDLGDVSGAQPVVHMIGGTNISVALVEVDGELQFTITSDLTTISQATIFSADLGSGAALGTGFTEDFVFGFSPIVFATPFLATTVNGANDDLARITAIALNTPVNGTVRITFDRVGAGVYEPPLVIGCSAFGNSP